MELDGIDEKEILQSLSLTHNRNMIFKAGEGAGASGSFFFFSHDEKLLIKTLRGKEKGILLGMLDDYVKHVKQMGNMSLLARIYGLYTIKSSVFSPLDIIIMQNTTMLHNKSSDKLTFDIKGST